MKKEKFSSWEFLKTATKEECTEAIKSLKAAFKLFGKDGKRWIKHTYSREGKNNKWSYCAVGALRKADGPGENLATASLAVAMMAIDKDLIDSSSAYKYAKNPTKKKLEYYACSNIPIVNDSPKTKFADIKKAFNTSIRKLNQQIAAK